MSLKIGRHMLACRRPIVSVFALLLCGSAPALAADPQPYRVDFAPSGERSVDASLKPSSELETLRTSAPVGPFGLIARAEGDIDRLKTVLESFGYYQGSVLILIDGKPLDDAELGDALGALPKGTEARVAVKVTLGPLYHLGRIDFEGEFPAAARAALGLASGEPAIASTVLAGAARMLTVLENDGYAFAKVDPPVAYEDPQQRVLNLSFHVDTGPRVRIGEIRIEGLKRVQASFVRKRLLLHEGDQYDAAMVEKARKDLLGIGVFSAVSVTLGTSADASDRVPVTFQMRERLRHAVTLNAGYSSDLGGSAGATWTDRNVLGNAQQLTLGASVINVGGSATTGVGYDTSAKFLMPELGHRDQSLQFSVEALKQFLQAYDQTAWKNGVTLSRKLSSVWSVNVGITTSREQILQEDVTRDYTLIALPLNALYDSTDLATPLDDPRHGLRGSLSLVPTRSLGTPNASFLISQVTLATYLDSHRFDLEEPGRGVFAVRGLVGLADGAGTYSLPPDQRFYAGGSGTIRGYRYQSVGPQVVNDGTLIGIGGTSVAAVNVEFRQRIGGDWGMAVFADGGQIGSNPELFSGRFRIGVGSGARYYTPIGPIRLDVALPLDRRPSDDRFEVYIGLGQSF